MYCSRCGAKNDDDAKFCEKCGADMAGMPKPAVAGTPPTAPPPAVMPPMVYRPTQPHLWWYPIGVWVILSAFFAFMDVVVTHTITWSIWPIGILGIFMVGFPVLHLIEGRAGGPRP